MSPKKNPMHGRKNITLRDVIVHIQAMKGEVLQKIGSLEKRVGGLERKMDGLERRMDGMEERLTQRIDALEEDLTATMRDALRIREHVGMPVPTE